MKKLKQITTWLMIYLGVMILFYLGFYFYNWEWMPALWSGGSRALFSLTATIMVAISAIINYFDFD